MKVGIVDLNANDAQQLVTESLVESGFAVVENHKIPVSALNDLYSGWDDFFLTAVGISTLPTPNPRPVIFLLISPKQRRGTKHRT